MAVAQRYIGESIRIAITFIDNIANYNTITADIKSITGDEQVIKSIAKSDIVIDTLNAKKGYIYISDIDTKKAYENIYNLVLTYSFANSNFEGGFEFKKAVIPVFKLVNNSQITGSYNDNDITINIANSDVISIVINSEFSQGTIDSNLATNKPSINNVELVGNKTLYDLGIEPKRGINDFYLTNAEKSELHTHTNKSVLDTITSVLVSGWNAAATWVSTYGANVLTHISDGSLHVLKRY